MLMACMAISASATSESGSSRSNRGQGHAVHGKAVELRECRVNQADEHHLENERDDFFAMRRREAQQSFPDIEIDAFAVFLFFKAHGALQWMSGRLSGTDGGTNPLW
jgi:hypothetical protein